MAALRRVPWEIRALLALMVVDGVAVVVTYSRFPPRMLYDVHHTGIAAGLGREVVALNYPFGLVGIVLVGMAWPRLHGLLRWVGVTAIAFCAVLYVAVRQANFDVKPLNAVPAIGLLLAVALVLAVGVPEERLRRGDTLRVALAAVMLFFAVPLIAAALGFFLDGVPFFGWFFETSRMTHEPGVHGLRLAVHHGEHHGWQCTMLALGALGLSRLPRPRFMDAVLALMLCYGVVDLVNDDWLEQVVKRGWTTHQVPPVQYPALNWGWAAIVVGTVLVWWFWFRQPSRTMPAVASSAISASP